MPNQNTAAADLTVPPTYAQRSALECRVVGGLDPGTNASRNRRGLLRFAPVFASVLADELTDASNSEDFTAERDGDRSARGAALALANLAGKVLAAS